MSRGILSVSFIMRAVSLAAALATSCVSAQAASTCHLSGTWADRFGGTATFTSNKGGTAMVPKLCQNTYKLGVTDLSMKGFGVAATEKRDSCTTFSAALTFRGGCAMAVGTITLSNGDTHADSWVKVAPAGRASDTGSTALTTGFK
jgi:hypothetical protein